MTLDRLHAQPPRLFLVNLSTLDELEAWANPPTLIEQRTAQWTRLQVPGLGHQPLQYSGTTNRQLPNVELRFDRRWRPDADLAAARRFLDGLVVPIDQEFPSGPPRVALIWPRLVSLEVVAESVAFEHDVIGVDGELLAFKATVTFEAVPQARPLGGGR